MLLQGEALCHMTASSSSQLGTPSRILQQSLDRNRHAASIPFLHQQSGLTINHHFGDSGMACGHHRQTTQLRFHHSHRIPLAIAIPCHQGMLHEYPRLPHQYCHLNLTPHPEKKDALAKIQLLHQRFRLRQQRPLPHHPELTLGLGCERSNRVQRALFGHKPPHRQTNRRSHCRRTAVKQMSIRSGSTDQNAILRRSQGLECHGHRLGFTDEASRQTHQAAITTAQHTQFAPRRQVGATEMHHQGDVHHGSRLHHAHSMKAKLRQHQIGMMASDQTPCHHRSRPTRQAQ